MLLGDSEFGNRIIEKVGELFEGTSAEIKYESELQDMPSNGGLASLFFRAPQIPVRVPAVHNYLQRAAVVRVLSTEKDDGRAYMPITPAQSEELIKKREIPLRRSILTRDLYPRQEHVGLLLESATPIKRDYVFEANALREQILFYKEVLNITEKDAQKNLLVVNPGLQRDQSLPLGLGFIIIPGVTTVTIEESLGPTEEGEYISLENLFDGFALNGVPLLKDIRKPTGRPIEYSRYKDRLDSYLRGETKDLGPRKITILKDNNISLGVLYRDENLDLVALCSQGVIKEGGPTSTITLVSR